MPWASISVCRSPYFTVLGRDHILRGPYTYWATKIVAAHMSLFSYFRFCFWATKIIFHGPKSVIRRRNCFSRPQLRDWASKFKTTPNGRYTTTIFFRGPYFKKSTPKDDFLVVPQRRKRNLLQRPKNRLNGQTSMTHSHATHTGRTHGCACNRAQLLILQHGSALLWHSCDFYSSWKSFLKSFFQLKFKYFSRK